MNQPTELTEYTPRQFSRKEISETAGEILWQHYGRQVAVEFPSPKTAGRWQLTAQGWVGHIPVTPDLTLALQPKVALGNLFRMLEYAYNLNSLRFLDGLVDCHSLTEFFEQLAGILARRILDRGRKGFYRAYVPQAEPLPYVRGRLNVRDLGQTPERVRLNCHYEEHTADIEENQILAWTLFRISQSGLHGEPASRTVRQAYRALQGLVSLIPHRPEVCQGRFYHRLNEDYQPLHALCHFFLDQSGPSHQLGQRTMLPFLVDMARLYERFVAEWLKVHLPAAFELKVQEKVNLSQMRPLHFDIDLVIYRRGSGTARTVLDTKYKTPASPSTDDIHQMISYAHTKGCREAILIHPSPLPYPLDETIRGIRIRSLTFSLDRDLDQAGQTFLENLWP